MSQPIEPESLDHLLAQVSRLHYLRAHMLLEAIHLYRGQPPVLRALWEQEGLSQGELAARLRVTPATITKMLQRMEKASLITRQPDAKDKRISRVHLTKTGRAIRGQVQQVWRTMEREAFAEFTPTERSTLHRFLFRVRENLIRATGEKPPF
jgi:MarR family transcriptional regulator, organic hydroperoxide resistance regulator